jgi:hypothetical protein
VMNQSKLDFRNAYVSLSETDLTEVAQELLHCFDYDSEYDDDVIQRVIMILRRPLIKHAENTITLCDRINILDEDRQTIRNVTQSELIPDDYKVDDDWVFAFGLLQLLHCRMMRVGGMKDLKMGICARRTGVDITIGSTTMQILDGVVTSSTSTRPSFKQELMDPKSIENIVDRIFLDS